MSRTRREKATITIRLTQERHTVIKRLCVLKGMTQTGYLASLATDQARKELQEHAVREYLGGKASLSDLARKTGLDVPTIMEAVAASGAEEKRAIEGFLKAARSLADTHSDPEFYDLAVKAVAA
ncbi:MAG: hypothetical protein A3H39_08010 [candidate division NC10 bacterium RIFCSPLOWO2_02_FULL_66_22]|nr:MAG: hypothetical protein A3H39_08010 [candidate division NC10 bacterium RIFCSPLOWO2_02_FULL_66_22]